MNGLARPNEVGKDIGFVTVIYPDEHVVAYAPDVYKENAQSAPFDNAAQSCQNQDKDLSVPNRDELLSMAYNWTLLEIPAGHYWSASEAAAALGWYQFFNNGGRYRDVKTTAHPLRCIKR